MLYCIVLYVLVPRGIPGKSGELSSVYHFFHALSLLTDNETAVAYETAVGRPSGLIQ